MISSYEPYAGTDLSLRAKQAMGALETAAKSLAKPDRRRTYAECANVIEELEAKLLNAEARMLNPPMVLTETGPLPLPEPITGRLNVTILPSGDILIARPTQPPVLISLDGSIDVLTADPRAVGP